MHTAGLLQGNITDIALCFFVLVVVLNNACSQTESRDGTVTLLRLYSAEVSLSNPLHPTQLLPVEEASIPTFTCPLSLQIESLLAIYS